MSIYFLLLYIASLFNRKARLLVRGQRKTLSILENTVRPSERWVWFHAASVGEFEQGRPIIERLKKEHPEYKILLTFFSPSGYEMHKDYAKADLVAYLPFATRRNARRMLQALKPEKAIFIKYEFWPAYLKALGKSETETYLISAIFNEKQAFFRWWGKPYRRLLNCFTHLYVQDEESKQLLQQYGIDNVTVAGDTRFDRVSAVAASADHIHELDVFTEGATQVLVAGSTWPEDERLIAEYIREHPEIKLVLVPHEINDSHLKTIFQLFRGRYVRFTEGTDQNLSLTQCLVIDKMGMLSKLYRYATVTYIGGGFGAGIHNTLEAAVYGKPVVFGPRYKRFREARNLISHKAAMTIRQRGELFYAFDEYFQNPHDAGQAAKEYVNSELGATEKIYNAIF